MPAGPVDAHTVWAGLTDVEKTGVGVAFMRWQGAQQRKWPDGRPWYRDPYGRLFVDQCIPMEEQQKMAEWSSQQRGRMFDFAAVRTAELDSLIADALADTDGTTATTASPAASHNPIRQMVILGAGMDTRAWRLQWPSGFSIYEVDTQAVLDFKSRVMSGAISGQHLEQQQQQCEEEEVQQQQQQQQQQHEVSNGPAQTEVPVLQCAKRVAVAADASKTEELWASLVSSGLAADEPILYLLEGFIGYLTPDAGNKLLSRLARSSAPNSRIIMTAPPQPDIHEEIVASQFVAKLSMWLPAFLQQLLEGLVKRVVHVLMFLGIVSAKQGGLKLHHATKEQPKDTLKRMEAAGWRECKMLTSQQIAAKYRTEVAQPILHGRI